MTRRIQLPPAALSPFSPEIIHAASAPFAARAWLASAIFILPALAFIGLVAEGISEMPSEGKRRVLSSALLLFELVVAAGVVAVHARRSRDRIDGTETAAPVMVRAWVRTLALDVVLGLGFFVAWVALAGVSVTLDELLPRQSFAGRLAQIVVGALRVADVAVFAFLATWLPGIRVVEGCSTGTAVTILRGFWERSRGRLMLHAAGAAAATWIAYMGMSRIVDLVIAPGGVGMEGMMSRILIDHTLVPTMVWTLPLAILGAAGVSSACLLRPLNGVPEP